MSMTQAEIVASERASYGGFIDAVGGIATIVLSIIGLSGIKETMLLPIVVIIFGAALLIEGGAMLSEYARIIFPEGATARPSVDQFGGGTLSVLFIVGAAGMVLGILALLGAYPAILTPIAVIAFGAALVLSANSVLNLHLLRVASSNAREHMGNTGAEILAAEMASGSAGIQSLAGLTAIVLGILAVVGTSPMALSFVALLALGATLVLTGTTLSGVVMSFMRPKAAGGSQKVAKS